MPKMCWKCGKNHEDGASACPFCGASFTSEGEKYLNDGRTISDKDETAYLSAPPPKYRRSHVILPAVIILAMVVAFIVIVASGFPGGDDPDARYDCSITLADRLQTDDGYEYPDEGMQFAILKIYMVNDKASDGISDDVENWVFTLKASGQKYAMSELTKDYVKYQKPKLIMPGESVVFYEVFEVPKDVYNFEADLKYLGKEKVAYDPLLPV